MEMKLSKEEYRSLIDLVYLGDLVINGVRTGDDILPKYKELKQYIYSFAKSMECDDIIKYCPDLKLHCETLEYELEGEIEEYLERYDEDVFWYEIMSRLAKRDVMIQQPSNDHLNYEEMRKKLSDREFMYAMEFDNYELNNVRVDFQKS